MPTRPLIDDTFTIEPRPAASMCGKTSWDNLNGASRLSSSVWRIASTGSRSAGSCVKMAPAAFTRISGPPSSAATWGTIREVAAPQSVGQVGVHREF